MNHQTLPSQRNYFRVKLTAHVKLSEDIIVLRYGEWTEIKIWKL